jgi:protein-tyrosine phosphatase
MAMSLDCNEVVPGRLWVGGFIQPEEASILKQMGITTIFSLQSDQDLLNYNISQEKLLKACAQAEIVLHRIPITDFDKQSLAANLPQAVAELEKALSSPGAKVYVHCTAGVNRGPTLAAAYVIRILGLPAREAYSYVVSRRYCNPYLAVLEEYELYLRNAGAG